MRQEIVVVLMLKRGRVTHGDPSVSYATNKQLQVVPSPFVHRVGCKGIGWSGTVLVRIGGKKEICFLFFSSYFQFSRYPRRFVCLSATQDNYYIYVIHPFLYFIFPITCKGLLQGGVFKIEWTITELCLPG